SRCPMACTGRGPSPKLEEASGPDTALEPGDAIYAALIPPGWGHDLQAAMTPSQRMAQEVQSELRERPLEELVPDHYRDFRDMFSKEAFNELPPRKPWDHAIDLTLEAQLPQGRTFPI